MSKVGSDFLWEQWHIWKSGYIQQLDEMNIVRIIGMSLPVRKGNYEYGKGKKWNDLMMLG